MANPPKALATRQYSEEEAALILQRAADLQGGTGGGGMSLAELQAVAKEAGIDQALVRQAAQDVRVPARADRSAAPSLLVGAPTQHVFERTVAGEVDSSAYEDLLTEIRRQVGDIGKVEQLGRMFAWRAKRGRDISVSVTPRAGRTLVRVGENTSGLAGGLIGGLGGGLGGAGIGVVIPICIAALGMPALIPVGLALWFFAAFMLARGIYRGRVNTRRVQLEQLADGLADVVDDLAKPAKALPEPDDA